MCFTFFAEGVSGSVFRVCLQGFPEFRVSKGSYPRVFCVVQGGTQRRQLLAGGTLVVEFSFTNVVIPLDPSLNEVGILKAVSAKIIAAAQVVSPGVSLIRANIVISPVNSPPLPPPQSLSPSQTPSSSPTPSSIRML